MTKDERHKINLSNNQKELLKTRAREQHFHSLNDHIRYKLFVEPDIKELIIKLFEKQQEILTKIYEKVNRVD